MSDLRKALEFYADPANYDDFIGRPPGRDSYFHSAHVKLDKGERARQALLIPPAPDGASEGLAKMIDKRLFILSGPEGSGAYVKIGFADIKDASSAHAALASLSVSPVRPKGEEMAELTDSLATQVRASLEKLPPVTLSAPSQPTQTGEENAGRRVMGAAEVHERWEANRYEAWALVEGLKFSYVFGRCPVRGWPHNFRNTAFDAVQALAATTPKATESQK